MVSSEENFPVPLSNKPTCELTDRGMFDSGQRYKGADGYIYERRNLDGKSKWFKIARES